MPSCFVVMGYGKKTDFATGRTLDLDKSYKWLIKPAVEACQLECIRADEIRHAGVIDVPMYEQLLGADVVVADLSTANPNAFYELGVRHALRPRTTVVIAESKLMYPFDVNHTVIRNYIHLGEVIDIEEAERFKRELAEAIKAVLAQPRTDSPVYTYLPGLTPPAMDSPEARRTRTQSVVSDVAGGAGAARPAQETPAVAELLAQANAAFDREDFGSARAMFLALHAMKPRDQPWTINDTYLQQRLALATMKSRQPTKRDALEEAQRLLAILQPDTSNDTETLGLWGSVHKRLWDEKRQTESDAARRHLDAAVLAYERGFYLRNDYYNGINFAFLLNVRASVSPPAEAIADFVQAQRVRRRVLEICEPLVQAILARGGAADVGPAEREQDYWTVATVAEAHIGLGDEGKGKEWESKAGQLPDVKQWMRDTTRDQLQSLRGLLQESPLKFVAAPART